MIDNKALTILKVTLDKTINKELHWEASEGGGEIFINKTASGYELRLYPNTDYDEEPRGEGPPSLTLYDATGHLVMDITFKMEGVLADDLENLYSAARRAAQNIDEKLDEILFDLTKDPDNPF